MKSNKASKNIQCESCEAEKCSAKKPHTDESHEQFMERQELSRKMCRIKHKILVLSGKGGVGKSTVAVNLATALSKNCKVGILDIDIHGPSIPKMLGVENNSVKQTNQSDLIPPIRINKNLVAMSIGFLLTNKDDALIWRGPMKIGVIKQFLKDVDWGELDYLIIDLPPGTGDEPLSIVQMIENTDGGIIVTTPQEVALVDVRKSINFCNKLNLPVLGVIENMSGFICPHCKKETDIFKKGGAEAMSQKMNVPFIGRIPILPEIVNLGDSGSFPQDNSLFSKLFKSIIEKINDSQQTIR